MIQMKDLTELFDLESENKLVLPNFQREFVWKVDQQKNLLATFLVGLPINSLLLYNGRKEDFHSKKLCFKIDSTPNEECIYLLDGQQRISTLKTIFSDILVSDKWLSNWEILYNDLKNVWFLSIEAPDEAELDIFGYKNLNYKNKSLTDYTPEEIVDFIEHFHIFKTKTNKWYHPSYEEWKSVNGINQLINLKARKFAEKKLLPMFGLDQEKKKLQEKTLSIMGRYRVEEIIEEIYDIDDSDSQLIRIKEVFDEIEIIDDIEGFKEQEETLKAQLVAKWSTNIINSLEDVLSQEIKSTTMERSEIKRVIAVFEMINKGGTPLDNFDLIVAKAAKDSDEINLTQRIRYLIAQEMNIPKSLDLEISKWLPTDMGIEPKNRGLLKKFKNQYLNILSIFSHVGDEIEKLSLEHIKKEKIFEISSKKINLLTEKSVHALLRALSFMNLRLGLIKMEEISYDLMLLPLAIVLINKDIWNDEKKLNKIEFWYWTSLFSGRYREKQNLRCVEDIKTLYKWVIKGDASYSGVTKLLEKSKEVLKKEEYSDYETLKDSSNTPKAIEKGILDYILSKKPQDLLKNSQVQLSAYSSSSRCKIKYKSKVANLDLNVHHLIPVNNATKMGESSSKIRNNRKHILNSILNKTKISSLANGIIKDLTLEKYMEELKEIARISHFLPSKDVLAKVKSEEDNVYYEKIMKARYTLIQEDLIKHLHNLLK
jgi:hypothetical protein